MTSFAYDLRYLTAGSEALESYLLSKDVYWPISIRRRSGEPGYPQLSLGGLLLAERRAGARANSAAEKAELDSISRKIYQVGGTWRVAWENKAALELGVRLNQWTRYLADYRSGPSEHYDQYPYEVFRRVAIELLVAHASDRSAFNQEALKALDFQLKAFLVPGEFIWKEDLQAAFPPTAFWYLYGRLPQRFSGSGE